MKINRWPATIACILVGGLSVASATTLSLTPSSWTIGPVINGKNYSSGVVPIPKLAAVGAGWQFTFPKPPNGKVGYITTPHTLSIAGKMLRMCFDIVGAGTFKATDGSQAKVRLYFQREYDNWSGAGAFQDYRWWSRTGFAVVTTNTGVCISSTMSPSNWSQVQGKMALARMLEFSAAMTNVGSVGFTFGGTFFGHGVYAETGSPKFILREFSIN